MLHGRNRRVIAALASVLFLVLVGCTDKKGQVAPTTAAGTAAPTTTKGTGSLGAGSPSGGAGPGTSYMPTGPLVADLGFRPEVNGFGFENYGTSENKNLTAVEVKRLFGDQVCTNPGAGECNLTPPAQQWMEGANNGMNGGHCYGFPVASLRMFNGDLKPDQFGMDKTTALPLAGNESLQKEIALSFVYQTFDSVRAAAISGTPIGVLDKLIEVLKAGQASKESYTIGFFNAQGGGGHAVTPFAVEDKGDGAMAVLIYDNNYPTSTKAISFDRKANSWSYEASTNPTEASSKYTGDANTKSLFLFPMVCV